MLTRKVKNNTARKGEITETIVLAKLVELGYECLLPFGHDCRYDIAIDDDGKLIRVQCKGSMSRVGSSALCVLAHAAFKTFWRKSHKSVYYRS